MASIFVTKNKKWKGTIRDLSCPRVVVYLYRCHIIENTGLAYCVYVLHRAQVVTTTALPDDKQTPTQKKIEDFQLILTPSRNIFSGAITILP